VGEIKEVYVFFGFYTPTVHEQMEPVGGRVMKLVRQIHTVLYHPLRREKFHTGAVIG
jgi:hypothetical protein